MQYTEKEFNERFEDLKIWDIDDPRSQVWYCESCKWIGYQEDIINDSCPECSSEDVFSYFEPRIKKDCDRQYYFEDWEP